MRMLWAQGGAAGDAAVGNGGPGGAGAVGIVIVTEYYM